MTELLLRVDTEEGTDPRRTDALADQLARDLRALRDVRVDRATTAALPGDKSVTIPAIGGLVVSGLLSAAGLNAIRDVVVAFVQRSGARSVTVRAGDREVVLTGVSAADLSDVAKQLPALLDPAEKPVTEEGADGSAGPA